MSLVPRSSAGEGEEGAEGQEEDLSGVEMHFCAYLMIFAMIGNRWFDRCRV